jgi:hypothetical protein
MGKITIKTDMLYHEGFFYCDSRRSKTTGGRRNAPRRLKKNDALCFRKPAFLPFFARKHTEMKKNAGDEKK